MPTSNQADERRRFQRIPFTSKTTISQNKLCWRADLKDISFKGALTSRPADWLGSPSATQFTIDAELNEEHHIRFTATLKHEEADTLGFHCESMDIDSASTLRRLVELNLGDPALLDREFLKLVSSD